MISNQIQSLQLVVALLLMHLKIARLIYEVYLDRGDEFLDSYDAVSEFFLELQQNSLIFVNVL